MWSVKYFYTFKAISGVNVKSDKYFFLIMGKVANFAALIIMGVRLCVMYSLLRLILRFN